MRVALVGTGGVAQRHIGVLRQLADVEIIAHVSSERARAESQSAVSGGRGYTEITEMLDREHPDAVWLCVTPDRHGPAEHALLDRHVPSFIEKPLAVDLEPAESIAGDIAAAGLVVAVGYKFRALDTLPRVRSLLQETPPRMVLGAWHDAMPPPPWWRQSRRSGGQMVEQATHLVDLARFLIGEAVVVSAQATRWPRQDAPDSDVADVHTTLLRFGDVPAVFTATSLLRGRQAIHLRLICEGRAITITEQHVLIETGRETHQFATAADPFLVEDRVFLEAVRARNPGAVLSTYADALETHRLCCRIRELSASEP